MKTVRISAKELIMVAHASSDKVLEDLFESKGIDLSKPFIKYFDFVGRDLVVEQED